MCIIPPCAPRGSARVYRLQSEELRAFFYHLWSEQLRGARDQLASSPDDSEAQKKVRKGTRPTMLPNTPEEAQIEIPVLIRLCSSHLFLPSHTCTFCAYFFGVWLWCRCMACAR
jgi:hypothetical protein